MNILLRKALVSDMPAVHALVRELAEFERAPGEVVTTAELFSHDAFNETRFKVILAEVTDTGEIPGMALFFDAYSTWKGKFIWLDDLIVKTSFRGNGIGKMLFDAVMQEAIDSGCLLMKWQVLDWNEPAIKFYEKMDTEFQKEWLTCRLTRERMIQLLGN